MTTRVKIEANRNNGKLSSGPVTDRLTCTSWLNQVERFFARLPAWTGHNWALNKNIS